MLVGDVGIVIMQLFVNSLLVESFRFLFVACPTKLATRGA